MVQANHGSSYGSYKSGWSPIPALLRADGDTSLHLFAANSVYYVDQSLDRFFLALYNVTASVEATQPSTYYLPTNSVVPMGCVDQYEIRNPTSNQSSGLVGLANLETSIQNMGLNPAQSVTALRLWYAFARSETFTNVYGSGASALKASDARLLDRHSTNGGLRLKAGFKPDWLSCRLMPSNSLPILLTWGRLGKSTFPR